MAALRRLRFAAAGGRCCGSVGARHKVRSGAVGLVTPHRGDTCMRVPQRTGVTARRLLRTSRSVSVRLKWLILLPGHRPPHVAGMHPESPVASRQAAELFSTAAESRLQQPCGRQRCMAVTAVLVPEAAAKARSQK